MNSALPINASIFRSRFDGFVSATNASTSAAEGIRPVRSSITRRRNSASDVIGADLIPADAMRSKIALSIKFLRGTAVGSSVLALGNVSNAALDTRCVRFERAACRLSTLGMYSSGLLRNVQSVPAAETKRPEATIRAGSNNHFVFIGLHPFIRGLTVLYTRDNGPKTWFRKIPGQTHKSPVRHPSPEQPSSRFDTSSLRGHTCLTRVIYASVPEFVFRNCRPRGCCPGNRGPSLLRGSGRPRGAPRR